MEGNVAAQVKEPLLAMVPAMVPIVPFALIVPERVAPDCVI